MATPTSTQAYTPPSSKPWADAPLRLLTTPVFTSPDKVNDAFYMAASHMAVVHNAIIRAYNSIYQQAPYVKPVDMGDFLQYCRCWVELVHGHHEGEEHGFFPEVEEKTGEKGLMAGNVEQHAVFHPGMASMKSYIDSCIPAPLSFSAPKLLEIMDSFGVALNTHLTEEIDTLLALSEYPQLDIEAMVEKEGKQAMGSMPKTTVIAFTFRNFDRTAEGGLWKNFPPGLPFFIRWWFGLAEMWHESWWRFACCDSQGRPKELYALADK